MSQSPEATDERGQQPLAQAVQADTGMGKTQMFVEVIAQDRLLRRAAGREDRADRMPFGYLLPTHRLGDDVGALWQAQSLPARVYRGREAVNPANRDEQMCLNVEQVDLAKVGHARIFDTCCRAGKKHQCQYISRCKWIGQFAGEQPEAWIAAHELLFHDMDMFSDELAGVCVDESFWQDGLFGIGDDEAKWTLGIKSIGEREIMDSSPFKSTHELVYLREFLARVLDQQPEPGGFDRAHLDVVRDDVISDFLGADDCKRAINLEWAHMPAFPLRHGMTKAQLRAFRAKHKRTIVERQFGFLMIELWKAIKFLCEHEEIKVSGRIIIKEESGKRLVVVRGVMPVRKLWQVPTMIMDATLPPLPMLQAYYPQVQLVGKFSMPVPHQYVQQVLKAPVSQTRLIESDSSINREMLRRYVLKRWLATGRKATLVICQQDYEQWLINKNLPSEIVVEHFNNITGLDRYRDVRLLILIGRVLPGPDAVEIYTGALTGAQPIKAPTVLNGSTWYRKVRRGIRNPDGTGTAVDCDEHPDPMAEMVRYQLCEAEMIQAIGRARGINRTADNPVDVDIVADVCLPITVNEVSLWWWSKPTALMETAGLEGVALTSPIDLAQIWPQLWPNTRAADRTLAYLRRAKPESG